MPKATKSEISYGSFTGECRWAHIQKPNTPPWGGELWCIDMVVPNAKVKKALVDGGINVKSKDGIEYFQVKQKTKTSDGRAINPPVVINADGTPCTASVGNGSKVKVDFAIRPYSMAGNKGVSLYLNKVTVIDLVEYTGTGGKVVDFSSEDEEAPF